MSTGPTLSGFNWFLTKIVQIPSSAMPSTEQICFAYEVALATVNQQIQIASPVIYNAAVYNLGMSTLLGIADDQPGSTYFSDAQAKWNILDFTPGVVQSTADNGDNTSLLNIETAKDWTVANLQQAKDPYGRAYLGYAASVGSLWGLT